MGKQWNYFYEAGSPHGQGLDRLAHGRPHLAQVLAGLPIPEPHWWPDKANRDVTLRGPSGFSH